MARNRTKNERNEMNLTRNQVVYTYILCLASITAGLLQGFWAFMMGAVMTEIYIIACWALGYFQERKEKNKSKKEMKKRTSAG